MSNNLHGDVSQKDLKLAKELLELEYFFDSKKSTMPISLIAKGYVCLSHDWYNLNDEDKGGELLEKANKVCPKYFKNQILDHMKESREYNALVKSLAYHILIVAKSIVEGIKDD